MNVDDIDKALTLTQPWCAVVAAGLKPIENRGWNAPKVMIGKRFALHASREIDLDVYPRIREIAPELYAGDAAQSWYPLSKVTGAIIGIARLVRVVRDHMLPGTDEAIESLAPHDRRWFFGPIGFVLAEVRALHTPIPCRGALNFWKIPPAARDELAKQLGGVLPGAPP